MSHQVRNAVYSACLTLLLVGIYANRLHTFRDAPDARSYISMAEGTSEGVRLHHAKRVLYPLLVRGVSQLCDVHLAFYVTGSLSLFGFLVTSCAILTRKIGIHTYYALPFLAAPFVLDAFEKLYYPGLLFLFLSALYFLFLLERKHVHGVLVLFALCLTRDEAIVIALVTLCVLAHSMWRASGFDRGRLGFGIGVVVAIAASSVVQRLMVGENENMHTLPGFVFSLGRMPLFLMRNFTGFTHWVDAYSQLPYYPDEPLFKMAAPAWLQSMSAIKEVGIYSWNVSDVLSNWLLITTSFGTLVTVVAFDALKRRRFPPMPSLAYAVAAYSGGIFFFLGPTLGPPSLRYFASAWPLFFISLGVRFQDIQNAHASTATRLFLLSVVCTWLWYPYVCGYVHGGILLPLAFVLHVCTWKTLARWHGSCERGKWSSQSTHPA